MVWQPIVCDVDPSNIIPNGADELVSVSKLPQNTLLGKVLRVNRDGTIPSDNPFPNSPVYTLGHRNIFGVAFDKNVNGVVTENGEAHYECVKERGKLWIFKYAAAEQISHAG